MSSRTGHRQAPRRARRSTPTTKHIIFIRHAESLYNEAMRLSGVDPMIRDAGLTENGKRQAVGARAALSEALESLGEGDYEPVFVVSSPLTRALHTALLARPQAAPAIEVWPELREVISGFDDIGTPASALRSTAIAQQASGGSESLGALDEVWWTVPARLNRKRARDTAGQPGLEVLEMYKANKAAFVRACEEALPARLDAIVQRCSEVPAKTIVIVAHSDLLIPLTRRLGLRDEADADPRGWEFRNAQVRVAASLRLS